MTNPDLDLSFILGHLAFCCMLGLVWGVLMARVVRPLKKRKTVILVLVLVPIIIGAVVDGWTKIQIQSEKLVETRSRFGDIEYVEDTDRFGPFVTSYSISARDPGEESPVRGGLASWGLSGIDKPPLSLLYIGLVTFVYVWVCSIPSWYLARVPRAKSEGASEEIT